MILRLWRSKAMNNIIKILLGISLLSLLWLILGSSSFEPWISENWTLHPWVLYIFLALVIILLIVSITLSCLGENLVCF